jgi:hypothetical protein
MNRIVSINCDWFSFYGNMDFVWVCLIIVCGCLYALIYCSGAGIAQSV